MNHHPNVVPAALLLALALGGCRGIAEPEQWVVATCVRVTEGGGPTAVACAVPHTHKVIAIAASAEACPTETDLYSQPADPGDGSVTICFQADTAAR